MRPQLNPLILGVGAPWSLPGSSLDLQFTTGRAAVNRQTSSISSLLTTTRASTGYASTSTGFLTLFPTNTPRITDLGLLVEQAATNLALRSQDFSNAYWTKNNSSSAAAASTAPDGTVTASSFIEAANTAQHSIFSLNAVALTSGVTYTVSTYVKVLSGTRSFVLFPQGGGLADAVFNLQLGTVTSTGGSQYVSSGIAALGSGWYRCWVTFTASSTANNSPNIYLSNDGTASPSYAGDGASGFYLWGFQFETGSFPTSYIPTTTVSVTRAADSIKLKGFPLTTVINSASSQGWIYAKALSTPSGSTGGIVAVNDNSSSNRIDIRSNQSSLIENFITVSGSNVADLSSGSRTANAAVNVAATWKVGASAISQNGVAAVTGTPGSLPTVTQVLLGDFDSGGAQLNNYIKRLAFGSSYVGGGGVQSLSAQ